MSLSYEISKMSDKMNFQVQNNYLGAISWKNYQKRARNQICQQQSVETLLNVGGTQYSQEGSRHRNGAELATKQIICPTQFYKNKPQTVKIHVQIILAAY